MLDARSVYRKVTRKIYDFSPEQEKNLLAVIWLYRGKIKRFLGLVLRYCRQVLEEGNASLAKDAKGSLSAFQAALAALLRKVEPFIVSTRKEQPGLLEAYHQLLTACSGLSHDFGPFHTALDEGRHALKFPKNLTGMVETLSTAAEESRALIKIIERLRKEAEELVADCQAAGCKDHDNWNAREINRARKYLLRERELCVERLKKVRYFWEQARWLTVRFPNAKYQDVPGLVKAVNREELGQNDWSLTPGRYVGIAPEEEDEDFDFAEAMRAIHEELEELNTKSIILSEEIRKNYERLIS